MVTEENPNPNLAILKGPPYSTSSSHQQECKQIVPTKVHYNKDRTSVTDQSPDSSLERKDNAGIRDIRGDIYGLEPAEQFWEQFNSSLIQSPKISRSISAPRTPSLGSARLVYDHISMKIETYEIYTLWHTYNFIFYCFLLAQGLPVFHRQKRKVTHLYLQ